MLSMAVLCTTFVLRTDNFWCDLGVEPCITTRAHQTGLHSVCVCGVGWGEQKGRNSKENKDLHFVVNFHFVLHTIMV